MGGVSVNFDAGAVGELADEILERVKDELETHISRAIVKRLAESFEMGGIWVPRLLDSDQLAQVLGISPSTARELMANGDLPRVNVSKDPNGRTYRIDPRDLNAWLEDRQEYPERHQELRALMAQMNPA